MSAGRSRPASGRVTTVAVDSWSGCTVTGARPRPSCREPGRVDPGAAHRVEAGVDREEDRLPLAHASGEVGAGDRVDERLHAAASGATDQVDVGVDEGAGAVDRDGLDGEATG